MGVSPRLEHQVDLLSGEDAPKAESTAVVADQSKRGIRLNHCRAEICLGLVILIPEGEDSRTCAIGRVAEAGVGKIAAEIDNTHNYPATHLTYPEVDGRSRRGRVIVAVPQFPDRIFNLRGDAT